MIVEFLIYFLILYINFLMILTGSNTGTESSRWYWSMCNYIPDGG